ncbi:MAG: hypothetical protein ABIE94_00165 [archaeon]
MKCKICGKKVEETFLKKLVGTYVKNEKGKKFPVCKDCQEKHSMKEIKEKL